MGFVFVSGNAALDFVGTRKWRRSEPEELLVSPKDMERWALESGLMTAPFDVSAEEFQSLTQLREAIYRTVTSKLNNNEPTAADIRTINTHLMSNGPRLQLVHGQLKREGDGSSLGSILATSAAELIAGTDQMNLKECGRPDCTRIFIDRSRSGTRTWCGMEECGNRIKAANYRSRRKAAASAPASV